MYSDRLALKEAAPDAVARTPRPGRGTQTLAGTILLALAASTLSACTPSPDGDAAQAGGPENFLWVFGRLYRDTVTYRNLLAFADRHDLSIVLAPASVSQGSEARAGIAHALEAARARGRPVLFNTGVFREQDGWPTGDVILSDPEWRAAYRDSIRSIAGVYLSRYPGGRVIAGHEDPLFSNWPHRDADNYRRHGAAMFQLQRSAIREVDPSARVGIFVLPSYVLEMYEAFMPMLREAGALPDFSLVDKYRGYSDARVGIDSTNAATVHLLRQARRLTDGRPVYYLGQDHTINTGYTPSRRAIRDNIEAALAAGVEGIGWYIRTRYVPTEDVSTLDGAVEPFQPLTGDVDTESYSTFTGDRDRFMFAYLATFEEQGTLAPEDRFDLWIHGADLDLHEARVSVRDTTGAWRFIGDLGTRVAGRHRYSTDGREGAVIFRALSRAELLGGGDGPEQATSLTVRIDAGNSEDGLDIHGVYAMPYSPTDRFITEGDAAAELGRYPAGVGARSLAAHEWSPAVRLEPGDTLIADAR
ncbi:MAG: hypothetical protein R3314_06170 [Longimicrobiales bacterium]|nr:hypothetical protein [Longimicrobiales bacterium]